LKVLDINLFLTNNDGKKAKKGKERAEEASRGRGSRKIGRRERRTLDYSTFLEYNRIRSMFDIT
jgi:hypothetical protein